LHPALFTFKHSVLDTFQFKSSMIQVNQYIKEKYVLVNNANP
jgi:hypothetical protein